MQIHIQETVVCCFRVKISWRNECFFPVLVRRFNGQVQLVLLDHGLYQRLSDNDRIALSKLWQAIVFNDHINMRKYSNLLGVRGQLNVNKNIKLNIQFIHL